MAKQIYISNDDVEAILKEVREQILGMKSFGSIDIKRNFARISALRRSSSRRTLGTNSLLSSESLTRKSSGTDASTDSAKASLKSTTSSYLRTLSPERP